MLHQSIERDDHLGKALDFPTNFSNFAQFRVNESTWPKECQYYLMDYVCMFFGLCNKIVVHGSAQSNRVMEDVRQVIHSPEIYKGQGMPERRRADEERARRSWERPSKKSKHSRTGKHC
jgi:hypothetical protein